jgi:hypothetical protein
MPWNLTTTHTQPGDLAMLVGLGHKYFILVENITPTAAF